MADAPAVPTTPPGRRVLPVAVALTVTAAVAATAALTIRAARRRSPAAAVPGEPPPPPPVPSWRQPGGAVWSTAGPDKPPADPAPVRTQRRRWPLPAVLIIVALLAALAAACAGMVQSETDSRSRYSDLTPVERPPHATFDMNDWSVTDQRPAVGSR